MNLHKGPEHLNLRYCGKLVTFTLFYIIYFPECIHFALRKE